MFEYPMFDYLVVGAGLYGATAARRLRDAGKSVLVIEKRDHIAGNAYTEKLAGINVHRYGPHIFHTNDSTVWKFVNQYASFNDFINSPVANYRGEIFQLPFNMHTFRKMWGVTDPAQAAAKIAEQVATSGITQPKNLEEQAISMVGRDIYEKLIKGYTQKQWGRECDRLPASIIKRIPVRMTYDSNYFDSKYQGIPIGGYTKMVEGMLDGIEVRLNTDYLANKEMFDEMTGHVIYTGPVDAFFDFRLGRLQYRTLHFETETLGIPDFQGNAVVNYTDAETPWTRIIEHKWFEFGRDEHGREIPNTVISREYSAEWMPGKEAYYPINDEKNTRLHAGYKELASREDKVTFGGRLGEYRYYDMDQVIAAAISKADELLSR